MRKLCMFSIYFICVCLVLSKTLVNAMQPCKEINEACYEARMRQAFTLKLLLQLLQ